MRRPQSSLISPALISMWGRLQPAAGFSPPTPRHDEILRTWLLEAGRTEARRRLKPAPRSPFGFGISATQDSSVIVKCLPLSRQPLQQASRSPSKLPHSLEHLPQSHRPRIPHRAAAIERESVPGDIDDIYIHRPQRNPFLQDLRALIDQCVDRPLDNLLRANRTRLAFP